VDAIQPFKVKVDLYSTSS